VSDVTYQVDRRGANEHATQQSGRAVGFFTISELVYQPRGQGLHFCRGATLGVDRAFDRGVPESIREHQNRRGPGDVPASSPDGCTSSNPRWVCTKVFARLTPKGRKGRQRTAASGPCLDLGTTRQAIIHALTVENMQRPDAQARGLRRKPGVRS